MKPCCIVYSSGDIVKRFFIRGAMSYGILLVEMMQTSFFSILSLDRQGQRYYHNIRQRIKVSK
ncbi:hypothetical protein U27_01251 [Candidatus Vecturithrix granuli]|uniref:Uncharacterized protein n=1 Tax=Vecturithrix granuli TaxID=1499967 RepID=A0A081C9U6_VECG1|nr:hypothetical protein U27_01251 [Candidatus Vecturithrix granuli]